jgi:magnesium transporter
MNFENMPELRWQAGYPTAIGSMLLGAGTLYVVFKRRGWL